MAELIYSGKYALHVLGRSSRTTDPYKAHLYEKLRDHARRRLRRATAAVVTDLDAGIVTDLMKVVKKLRNGEQGSKEFDRVKTSIELLEHTLDKKRTESLDIVLWKFNEIYKSCSIPFG